MWEDNNAAIDMISNPSNKSRAKHIAIRMAFVREASSRGQVKYSRISSACNAADALTKPLGKELFNRHAKVLLGCDNTTS